MTVTLPDELRAELEHSARTEGLATVDEYVALLCLRAKHDADTGGVTEDERRLVELVREGLDSGPAVAVGEEFWDSLRRAAKEKAAVGGGVG